MHLGSLLVQIPSTRPGMRNALIPQSRADVERHVFWAAPTPRDADLAPEDPLALDYLGQQIGYWLFGAFTTRTSRAQYFPVVLYGLDLAGEHASDQLPPTDSERVERFERWERFWALATIEFNGERLPRNSEDSFRGVRGANNAWKAGETPLSLDFQLISRQSELGALGAYLSALRQTGLVLPGSLRPSPASEEILEAFWDEPKSGARVNSFDRYARGVVYDEGPAPRRWEGVTLRAVGERTRLTSLVARRRRHQQDRLWSALFLASRDDTLAIAELLRAAARRSSTRLAPEQFLERAVNGTLGSVPERLQEKLSFALLFGNAARALLERFNAIYAAVSREWVAPFADVVRDACSRTELRELRSALVPVLDHPLSSTMRALPMHGSRALGLFADVQKGTPDEVVRLMLDYHHAVQRERQRGSGWVRTEGGQLVLSLTSYSGHKYDPAFPSFKLNAVQALLHDLGKLP